MLPRNLYLRIAYDGTDFHGWQTQPGLRTVQGVLESWIPRVVRHPIELIGSGRTDAGVHAVAQVASLRTSVTLPTEKLRHALGSRLPEDLTIAEVRDARQEFNARRSCTSKVYRYRIWNSRHRPVERLAQRYTYHCWHPLDIDRMVEAARHFLGERDFAAMAARGSQAKTTVRTVLRCDIERHEEEIWFDVEGTGFLYNQVRNMVGALLMVGADRREPSWVGEVIAGRNRALGGPTMPARGLCLRCVHYPPHLFETAVAS